MLDFVQRADEAILLFIQENTRFGFLNFLMKVITFIGNVGLLWICIGLLLILFKKRANGLKLLIVLAVCWCISDLILKDLVCRSRPFITMEELTTIISFPRSYSFPSGHACSSFASAYALTKMYGKKGAIAYIPASLIAISRVYLGVHYPSDVIAGAVIGTLGAIPVYYLLTKYLHLRNTSIMVKKREEGKTEH